MALQVARDLTVEDDAGDAGPPVDAEGRLVLSRASAAAATQAKGRMSLDVHAAQRAAWAKRAVELTKPREQKLYPSGPQVRGWHGDDHFRVVGADPLALRADGPARTAGVRLAGGSVVAAVDYHEAADGALSVRLEGPGGAGGWADLTGPKGRKLTASRLVQLDAVTGGRVDADSDAQGAMSS
jgi:hypothetical protein